MYFPLLRSAGETIVLTQLQFFANYLIVATKTYRTGQVEAAPVAGFPE